jgi:GNAT superfamily N-acetyltransferase
MVEVRKAKPEEAPVLLELIRALADYEKLDPPAEAAQGRLVRDIFGERPRLEAWLAFVDGTAAGYALILETYSSFLALPTLYLEDLFVLPEFRSRRAGSALFRRMVKEADARGCGRMEWTVLDWNTLAQDFYRRYGARQQEDWQYWRLRREEFGAVLDDTVLGDA